MVVVELNLLLYLLPLCLSSDCVLLLSSPCGFVSQFLHQTAMETTTAEQRSAEQKATREVGVRVGAGSGESDQVGVGLRLEGRKEGWVMIFDISIFKQYGS